MNNLNAKNLIIFTDLDGTMLDHESYSYAPAKPALDLLHKNNIPLILASSKTAAEIAPLRASLGFEHCEAIVENGYGILPAFESPTQNQEQYSKLRSALDGLPENIRKHFKGFGDWSVEEVSDITGLTLEDAAAAKTRQYSEPGIWSGDDQTYQLFLSHLESLKIIVQQGGRFSTLSFGGNKATRVIELCKTYSKDKPDIYSIALGDAKNDIAMLEAVDLGIIIPNNVHGGIPPLSGEENGTIIRAKHMGPKGWSQSLIKILENTL